MAKKRKWYYVSRYERYPIYEAAEGGYYYDGMEYIGSTRFGSLKKARKWLKIWAEEEGMITAENYNCAYTESKYIGEGSIYRIETVCGCHESGYKPYC